MNDDLSKYGSLINLMEATPKAPAPDHFTERVMGRLPELDQGLWAKVKRSLLNPSWSGIQSRWAQIMSVSDRSECSYYFLITGSFYLIMAMVLMLGFKGISSSLAATNWIKLQPHITFGIAMWLLALGAILMMDGRKIVRMVKLGTLFYIFFTIFNGILMRHYFNVPYGDIFLVGFVGGSVFMGILLAFAVKKMELRLQ